MSAAADDTMAETEAAPRLPAAYAPFLPVLEQLSEPMLRILRGQLAQLERMARILEAPDLADQGDFEGLGGLTLRGDLSQIVQSELLLRTEEPLEFLRRLAESETLYHEKRYAEPGARPVYRVMISTGPGSLGHGRMVALAALFFLARIARVRGAELHWCYLPRAEGAIWFEDLTAETVRRLLRAASFREMEPEDVEAATDLWKSLAEEKAAPGARAPDPTDWTIGARRGQAAVSLLGGSLSFTLGPPSPGAARSADVALRQKGRERARAQVDFPDDRICVSALNDPFRPLSPSQTASLPGPRRELIGWDLQYFTSAGGNTKIVRLQDGLLILRYGQKLNIESLWFVPLPADAMLVGVRLQYQLQLLIRRSRANGDTLTYGQFLLHADPRLGRTIRSVTVATEHLLTRQRPYALPPLFDGVPLKFCSQSGHGFEIDPYSDSQKLGFRPVYKGPLIVGTSGAYAIFRDDAGGGAVLRVLKIGGGQADAFREAGEPVALNRLYGMVYSRPDRSLAYSLAPNRWTIPTVLNGREGDVADRPMDLTVGREETVLSARHLRGGVAARLWSDLRAGGTGEVRNIRRGPDGRTVQPRPSIKLGDDASHIVRMEASHEGFWALKADDAGAPTELLLFRLGTNGKTYTARFDLESLRERAKVLDVRDLDG